jgi:hypothetical protein
VNSSLKQRLLLVRWWIFHLNRRQIRRLILKRIRPASDPYLSGDGFRRLAQHIFDETNQRLRPTDVLDGEIVFVSTEYAFRFFQEVAHRIAVRYRLITHNSDVPVDSFLAGLAPPNIESWFALNATHQSERVIPLPIGLENGHFCFAGVPGDFDAVRSRDWAKKVKILSGFTIATNPGERQRVQELAARVPCVEQLPSRLTQSDYLRVAATYKFLLCPPGNGLDTHRAWEAMYLGVVPIVKDSVAMRYFAQLGLPLWILESWEELLSLRPDELEAKYEALKGGFDSPALFMDYWRDLVRGRPKATEPVGREHGVAHA